MPDGGGEILGADRQGHPAGPVPERQNTPEKQWKITEEDWRNREKWDAYEEAVDEMLARTSTERAPWHILESVDKRYARIKAMRLVIGAIRQTLDR